MMGFFLPVPPSILSLYPFPPSSYHLYFPWPVSFLLLFCSFSRLTFSASFNWSWACTWTLRAAWGLHLHVTWRRPCNRLHKKACASKCSREPHCQYQHLAFCSFSNSGDKTCSSACLYSQFRVEQSRLPSAGLCHLWGFYLRPGKQRPPICFYFTR